jgi:hypothetical protein
MTKEGGQFFPLRNHNRHQYNPCWSELILFVYLCPGLDSWIEEEDWGPETLIQWKADTSSPVAHGGRDSNFLGSSANENTLSFKNVISSVPVPYLGAPVQVLEAVESHGDLKIDRSFSISEAPQIRHFPSLN